MMEINEIAHKLVELCRVGKNEEAYKTLFAENASAYEPKEMHGRHERHGLATLLEGNKHFQSMVKELHRVVVTEPTIISPSFFACGMGMDFTRQDGHRVAMNELCVYEVENGKIVKETFYHS